MSPDANLLTRGKIENQAIGNGVTSFIPGQDSSDTDPRIFVGGDDTLIIEVDMTGGAIGDLAVAVQPYEADNATVMPISLPRVQEIGPLLQGGHVYLYQQYDVTGIEMVRVNITNNNAAPQTITRASWRIG